MSATEIISEIKKLPRTQQRKIYQFVDEELRQIEDRRDNAAAERAGFTLKTDTSQADWLRSLGIDELADEGAAAWREGAHRGDLAALAGRSQVHEAEALTDPAGLGAHRVVLLRRGIA